MKIAKGQEVAYKEWLDNNTDSCLRECFTYAERWAEMLEKKIDEIGDAEKVIFEHATYLSHRADVEGITGFMYGCSVAILDAYWKYGEELRKWYNKKYNYEGHGIVNQAIMCIP